LNLIELKRGGVGPVNISWKPSTRSCPACLPANQAEFVTVKIFPLPLTLEFHEEIPVKGMFITSSMLKLVMAVSIGMLRLTLRPCLRR